MSSTPSTPFLQAIKEGPLVLDGAMGTQLYERGVFINRSLEGACLLKPSLVRRVHEEYIDAGAQVIQTHTFAANRLRLSRHNMADKVVEINQTAVALALEASQGRAYVAGSVGPTGKVPETLTEAEYDALTASFKEQITLLVEGGVDVLVLETFRLLSEIRVALKIARKICRIPIIAQMAFDAESKTADGAEPGRVAELLKSWGADVVGANCVEGPGGVFKAASQMVGYGVPVSAVPNAGYPRLEDGRRIYMATPEYFGVYARRFYKAGVSMVGGCCGTSPDHIRKIRDAARMMGHAHVEVMPALRTSAPPTVEGQECPIPLEEKTQLGSKIHRVWNQRIKAKEHVPVTPDNFVVSVEVNPPSGLNPRKAIEAAKMLQKAGVDVINIADGPRASVRMSNQALAILLQKEIDMEVILHFCGRDRNLLRLQSDLLANNVLGLHNLVVITGDPPKMGDYPHATAVFDLDSIGMLRMIKRLNRGVDPAGKLIGQRTRFVCATGAEPAALDYDREIRRLEKKRDAGAEFVMTQPVYDPAILEKFLKDIEHLDMPVLMGLLPLASYRNAEFLHNEVPGMRIPDEVRERMRKVGKGPAARSEGVKIAQEALLGISDKVVGAYIMPPFGRHAAALEILECIGYTPPA